MKMRTKVILINVLSIFVVLMISLGMLRLYFELEVNPTIKEYYNVRHELYDTFRDLTSIEDCCQKIDKVHQNPLTAFLIMNMDGKLVKAFPENLSSDFENFKDLTPSDFVKRLSISWYDANQEFFSESIINQKAGLILYYFSLKPAESERKAQFPMVGSVLLVISLLLISISIISSLVLQKTSSNVQTLEKATRRIAKGDLDFELKLTGQDEVAGLANSFNAMRLSLIDEKTIRNRFLMGVSHDLKTPLTTIKGYLEAIKDGVISEEELPHVMDRMTDKTKLLESRILELINYVKLQTGEWILSLENVSINNIFSDLEEAYRDEVRIANRSICIDKRLQKEVIIPMDSALFIRLIENLVNNAIKYSKEGSTIEVTLDSNDNPETIAQYKFESEVPECIEISIRSYGEQIFPEDLALVFEPFYRINPSRNTPGFGLGLSIVKSIVDAHGWKITVDSDEKNGTCFKIIIPINPIQ